MSELNTGFFSYFIRSYRVTFLIILALAVFGISTAVSLPRESTPEIEIPFGIVVTAYPGASARDVEELVTRPIEDALADLSGVKEITSSSSLGISSVNVEFNADEDLGDAIRRLREEVDKVRDLPSDAIDSEVVEINFTNEPIISVGLSGVDDQRLLTIYAEDIAEEIETIPGVSNVVVVGSRQEEIVVRIQPQVLATRGISVSQILGALSGANINAPFGRLETSQFGYDLRIAGGFENVSDVAELPISASQGSVLLKDIAHVESTVNETSSSARISVDGSPATPAVTIQVFKQTGGNIIDIVDTVTAEVDTFVQEELPEDVVVSTFSDRASDIRKSLSDVTRSGIQTFIIVFLILWVFLGWKEAIIASTAVPFTFFISFIVFDLTDITLNGISLFSLILSLGLLVDTAIVIVEGIHAGAGRGDIEENAAGVLKQFQKPLTAGVMTTVAAFFPMLLVSGIMGQFLRTIPIVISATLLSSLFVALALLPAVAVSILKRWPVTHVEGNWFNTRFERFRTWYDGFITKALNNRRFQNRFIVTLVILMVLGLSLPFTGLLKTGLFPSVDIDFILGNVELPPGSRLEETEAVLTKIEADLREVDVIESFSLNAGSSTSFDLGGGSSSENLGSFFINLKKDRNISSVELSDVLRKQLAGVSEAQIEIADISAGPPTAPPVEAKVVGPEIAELDRISQELVTLLEDIPGAIEVDRDLRFSAGAFEFTLNNEQLADAGLSPAVVAQALRTYVFGVEATTFLDQRNEEVSVQVQAPTEAVDTPDDIEALQLVTPGGQTVTLGQVADVALVSSVNTIRHRDRERTVTVTANVGEGSNPNAVSTELQQRVGSIQLPTGYHVIFGGEQQETEETFADLYRSMIIAVIAIMAILVIEFNSYRQPLIILIAIPLALIGVLFGLLILGGQLNFASFIGLVSLTGIVVNNAILLVDRMNTYVARGLRPEDAAKRSTHDRLRPIILTTITTAAGVAPLIWVDEFFRDLALTIITGLIFSTVLTLVLIPILYVRQQKKLAGKTEVPRHRVVI
ncbi:MAG: efflux RND transporter permease subunit [Candidatus Andersenbacteria bacterium]